MIYTISNGLIVELESITEVQITVRKYHCNIPADNRITPKPRKVEENDVITDIMREVFEDITKRRG